MPSWPRRATRPPSSCSPTPRCASRAARLCNGARRTTRIRRSRAISTRCALKTGKLFEAACLLGCGGREPWLGEFGTALGIAFQITDDILDCTGEATETGKIAGVDLREGTPTLPLLLAAREDRVVHEALAGGPLDGALVRVAATGALEQSRAMALDYADRARACLDGHVHREELEAFTHLVVDRDS